MKSAFIQSLCNVSRSCSVFVALVLSAVSLFAQNNGPADPKRGAAPGALLSISDIENINLTNGNLMLNMPMVSLPASRGGLSASYGMSYNSKNLKSIVAPVEVDGQVYDHNLLYESDAGSWRLVQSLNHQLIVINRFQNIELSLCGPNYRKNGYRWKVKVEFADGQEKEFRPVGYGDEYNDGFFDVSPNGDIGAYGYTPGVPPTCTYTVGQHSGPLSYVSIDGSYLRMTVQHDNDLDHTNNPFTIHYPDGSYYSSTTRRLTDRNGNYLEPVSAMNYDGRPVLGGVQDQFQRKVFYTQSGSEYYLYQFGFNGAPMMWTVKMKTIFVQKSYTTTPNPGLRNRGGPQGSGVFTGQFDVVDEIIPPIGSGQLKYEFEYDGSDTPLGIGQYSVGWGQLIEVKLPSGARAQYTYQNLNETTDKILERSVSSKTLIYNEEYDGQTTPAPNQVWSYVVGPTTTTVVSPDAGNTVQNHGSTSFEHPHNGLVKRVTNPDGSIVEKFWRTGLNAVVTAEATTLPGGGQAFIKTFTHDNNGNVRFVNEYGFISPSSIPRTNGEFNGNAAGDLLRQTETTYYNSSEGTDYTYLYSNFIGIRNLTKSVEVRSGVTPVSRTEMMYDNQPFGVTYAINAGNLTSSRTWDSTKGPHSNPLGANSITASTTYNTCGMPTSATDAKSILSVITYDQLGGTCGLYPIQTVTASGTNLARTSTATYDFNTGLVTSATDSDNWATTTTGYDSYGRPTSVVAPNGATTSTQYFDVGRYVVVRSDVDTFGDQRKVAIQHFDQLGRVRLSRTLEDPATESADNEQHGIKVQTRFRVGSGHTYQLTSNPYRASTSQGETGGSTMGWTMSDTSSTGLISSVATYSGYLLPGPWGPNTNSTGTVTTQISGNSTTVTDQAGKQRRSTTNALGQLTQVDEPDINGSLTQSTTYAYDTLNNLTTVNQGSQTRTFNYSSLSRLISATNPELGTTATNGTINYGYDNNGNLTSKTDPRGVTTTYIYDALNRVTNRNYSGAGNSSTYLASPNVTYTYDQGQYAKGRLTKVHSSVSTTEYTEFDILGRVKASRQNTDGTEYGGMTYTYNASGALVEQKYPSGRVVKTTLDADGSVFSVQSKKTTHPTYWNYAWGMKYNAAGGLTEMQYGNGRWESTQYNERLQPTQIALGYTPNSTHQLKLNYSYGGWQNNGNVTSQTVEIWRKGQDPVKFYQEYQYDNLNRIKEAEETDITSGGSTQTWKQVYDIDRYGNRMFGAGTTTIGGCPTQVCNPAPDIRNRLVGYSYDNAGNTTVDGMGQQFTYDSENKQVIVKNSSNVLIGEYSYDGDGKRVKKYVPSTGETTVFVYDAMGKSVAEYSNIVEPPTAAKVAYLTNDHLGSPRLNTDRDGNITARNDYLPYGEEITVSLTPQRADQGYTPDTVRKQFTGYERDDESELDFAQARYYSAKSGRFLSPDPLHSSASPENPQTLSRFAYVGNNPVNITDPSGLIWAEKAVGGKIQHHWFDTYEQYEAAYQKDNSFSITTQFLYCSDSGAFVSLDRFRNKWEVLSGEQVVAGLGGITFARMAGYTKHSGVEGSAFTTIIGAQSGLFEAVRELLSYEPVRKFLTDPGVNAIMFASMTRGLGGVRATGSKAALGIADDATINYSLRALEDGLYPVMERGSRKAVSSIFLHEGDVWKFGQTMNAKTRYSQKFLRENRLGFNPEGPATSLRQALQTEYHQIVQHQNQFGTLPAGNKVRR